MKLTDEQLAIIRHDLRAHAKVLAVAGAGKTSTMVERIDYLVRQCNVPQQAIRVVMFNKRIQEEFDSKVKQKGLEAIKVQTFHSLGNAICSWAVKNQLMASYTTVEDDAEIDDLIREAAREVLAKGGLRADEAADLEENLASHVENLRTSISIWKGMMTPPERAGHLSHPCYVRIYEAYEVIRCGAKRLTFDDMIYEAVELIEQNAVAQENLIGKVEHFIVDEFQDVNYSKQRLLQLLAGATSKVMVVGDDDQCIYEWTGANPAYIRRRFQETFTHFPHAVYRLSRSFRFGPAIALSAANCIAWNTDREVKELVANEVGKPGLVELHVVTDSGMGKEPTQQVLRLLEEGVPPCQIIVLVRNYIQSFEVQAALFGHGVPFFVDGERPFVSFFAVRCLRWYLALVHGLEKPLNDETRDALLEVIYRPKRYVNKLPFRNAVLEACRQKMTPGDLLRNLPDVSEGIQPKAFPSVRQLANDLEQAWRAAGSDAKSPDSGHRAAARLLERIDFRAIFTEFQAEGRVEVNLQALGVFRDLLKRCKVPLSGVEQFARSFDTKLGREEGECIKITSIFKEKGREYDHVILPQLVEGQLPCHVTNDNQATDKLYPERWPPRSSLIESERRLFYVALTRARKAAYLFTSRIGNQKVSRFIHEAFIPETMAAVNAVHGIMRSGSASAADRQALLNAVGHGEMKLGVLSMLSDALQTAPACMQVVYSLLPEVVSVALVPFRYPEAYPDPSALRPVQRRGVGLPF